MGCAAPEVAVVETDELTVLDAPPEITRRLGRHSGPAFGGSLWMYGETLRADGTQAASSASWTEDLEASDGIDSFEELQPSLTLTDDEQAFNANNNGQRWVLQPGAVVEDVDRGRVLIFYQKVKIGPDPYTWETAGSSIAVWSGLDQPMVREQVRPGTSEPTLMFWEDEPAFGDAAVIQGDRLYAWACDGTWTKECTLARAPLEDVLTRDAWEFSSGAGGKWSGSIRDVRPLFSAHSTLSVSWNVYLDQYVAFYNRPLDNDIYLRLARAPEGPWSAAVLAYKTEPYDRHTKNFGGLAHGEYNNLDGRDQFLTYYEPYDDNSGARHLVRLRLE